MSNLIYLQAPSEGDVTTFLCIQSTPIQISLCILISFNGSTQKSWHYGTLLKSVHHALTLLPLKIYSASVNNFPLKDKP